MEKFNIKKILFGLLLACTPFFLLASPSHAVSYIPETWTPIYTEIPGTVPATVYDNWVIFKSSYYTQVYETLFSCDGVGFRYEVLYTGGSDYQRFYCADDSTPLVWYRTSSSSNTWVSASSFTTNYWTMRWVTGGVDNYNQLTNLYGSTDSILVGSTTKTQEYYTSGNTPSYGENLLTINTGPVAFDFVPEWGGEYQLLFANYFHSETYPSYSLMTSDQPICYAVPSSYTSGSVSELSQLPYFRFDSSATKATINFQFENEWWDASDQQYYIPKVEFASDRTNLSNLVYLVSNFDLNYCNGTWDNPSFSGVFNPENGGDLGTGWTFDDGLGRYSSKSEFFDCDIDWSGSILSFAEPYAESACRGVNAMINGIYGIGSSIYGLFVPSSSSIQEHFIQPLKTEIDNKFQIDWTELEDLTVSEDVPSATTVEVLGNEVSFNPFDTTYFQTFKDNIRPITNLIILVGITMYNINQVFYLLKDKNLPT